MTGAGQDPPISHRAAMLMSRLAGKRYRTLEDARAFAQTHLESERLDLPQWVEGYEGDVPAVINGIDSRDIVSRQIGGYATPEDLELLRTMDLRLVAEGLLRDFDSRFTSFPESAARG